MSDAAKLLNKVIGLIEKDVTEIAKLSDDGKLAHLHAQDLVNYSRALVNLQESLENVNKKRKSKLSELSTEQLMELAKNALQE